MRILTTQKSDFPCHALSRTSIEPTVVAFSVYLFIYGFYARFFFFFVVCGAILFISFSPSSWK